MHAVSTKLVFGVLCTVRVYSLKKQTRKLYSIGKLREKVLLQYFLFSIVLCTIDNGKSS